MQYITRKLSFDSGHRVLFEALKCHKLHGHTYLCELTFKFQQPKDIGYVIDFKEIKRVAAQWIDDVIDHGMILNPHDNVIIKATQETAGKLWLMSLNGQGNFCNPTVENIARELFICVHYLMSKYEGLELSEIVLYETPNCYTRCTLESVPSNEWENVLAVRKQQLDQYSLEKGMIEYDSRLQ